MNALHSIASLKKAVAMLSKNKRQAAGANKLPLSLPSSLLARCSPSRKGRCKSLPLPSSPGQGRGFHRSASTSSHDRLFSLSRLLPPCPLALLPGSFLQRLFRDFLIPETWAGRGRAHCLNKTGQAQCEDFAWKINKPSQTCTSLSQITTIYDICRAPSSLGQA